VLVVVGEQHDPLVDSILDDRVEVAVDCVKGFGPLAGLVTAFTRSRSEWVLAVAADMPLLKPEVISLLWECRGDADAVVPSTHRGLEPLLALYNVRCFGAALDVLGTSKGGPRRLLDLVDIVKVTEDQLRAVDPSLDSLVNVNTPADAVRAARMCVPPCPEGHAQLWAARSLAVADG
jgi:molybdopterin-guanine dinucleotide biosynthesis protein A